MRPSKNLLGTLLITTAMGATLVACDRNTAIQPLSGADMALPATAALTSPGPLDDRYGPPPKKIPVGRVVNPRDDWAWAERSYALDTAFYDTPPDYGFYYDDYEPWVWQTSDRWAMYGDPYDYGYPYDDSYYYYYYEPGAVRPYFIRDASYGYGFDDFGRLVVIYDLLGRLMPQSFLYEREPYVSRYYQRAYLVRQASLRAQPVVITQEVWLQQAPIVQRYQQRWIEAAQTQPQWVDYRQRTGDRFVRAFQDDRRQRQQRVYAASGAAQQPDRGFLTDTFGARTEPAQVAQDRENRRGFLGFGGGNRDRAAPAQPQQQRTAQAERGPLGGLFGGGRERQREERALRQQQAQSGETRRGFLNRGERRAAEQPALLQDQARGRDRQALARERQAQQRQLEAQARQENGRQRQQLIRQHQAEARQQVEAQARQERGRERQEAMRQQRQAEAQAREQQQAQARQEQGRQRQEAMRQQRQAEAQAREQQQAQARQEQGRQRQEAMRQQHEAQAQARAQQQAQARQAEAQARQQQAQAQARAHQQQAQQRQAEAQVRQQQAQQAQAQQAQAQQAQAQQAQAQRQQKAAEEKQKRDKEAEAAQQGGGRGHGKKG